MKLKEILTISGKPGLHKLIKQTGNGVIVESIEDKKRFPAFAHQKISSLEEISIYTDTEDMPLKDVLKKMAEQHERGPSINPKSSSEELKSYFAEIVPEYDEERVYVSHIKKIIQWYNILQKNDLLDFEEEEEEASGEEQSGSSQAHEEETGQQDEGQSDQSTKEENNS